MPNAILDPTGGVAAPGTVAGADGGQAPGGQAPGAASGASVLAPRPRDLRGARVGLLVNTKKNADIFLDEVGKLLLDTHGAASVLARTKLAFAQPASEELIKEFAAECDVVITGVGDCGSCSASAVADGVALEGRGLPAAVICSDAFRGSADAIAALRGAPGYRYAVTPHPVAVLTPGQVRERAAAVLADVVNLLVAPADGAGQGAAE